MNPLPAPPAWTQQAACLDADPTHFDNADDTARAICAACPVRLTCALTALTNAEPRGIYGGLTPADRRALAADYGFDTPGAAPHGSRSRYARRRNACRCDLCRAAHRTWARTRRAAGAWNRTTDTQPLSLAS